MRRAMVVVLLAAAGVALEATPALALDWTVKNDTTLQIYRVFVSPCGSDAWGPNLLATGVLEPGQSHVVKDLAGSCYEAKIVDEDGDVCVVTVRGESLALTKPFLIKCQGHQGVYSPQ